MINGNIAGIRDSIIEQLELLYEMKLQKDEFVSPEMAELLAKYSGMLNREISVYITRGGKVMDVSVGGSQQVQMPYIRKRRGTLGLSGIRCIHTHPNGAPMLSDVDTGTLLSSRLDAMAAIAVKDEKPTAIGIGMIGETLEEVSFYGPYRVNRMPNAALMAEIARKTAVVAELVRLADTAEKKERAMLIGLNTTEESMKELALLTDTAGAEVVFSEMQKRPRDKGTYIGSGKARELALAASALDADIAIFNDELTPTEEKNLEEILGLKIIDRTTLILDIFAGRARTREGKLQVELAQMKYNLPRLSGEGVSLSRLGGGIGTRGPGEKKIETDRRRIRRRIYELEQEIDAIGRERQLRRAVREKNRVKEVALVGYTNAGKSTLLNTLSNAGVYADDRLFATLDTVTRRVTMPDGSVVLFTDTVGFIDKLPHDLVSAFRSTLEEAMRADLLLIVTDLSNEKHTEQTDVVKKVLEELGAGEKPALTVYNKCDRISELPQERDSVCISAKQGIGIDTLLETVAQKLKPQMRKIVLKLGYQEGARFAELKRHAESMEIEYAEDGMVIHAELPEGIEI